MALMTSVPTAPTPHVEGPSRIRRTPLDRLRERGAVSLFLLPIAAVLVLLYLIPLAQSAYYSFTDYDGYSPSAHFVGLRNYKTAFTDSSMFGSLTFTMVYAVTTTLVITVLAIPLAVVLNRRFVGRNFVRSVFFFPAVPSVAILGLVWTFILNPLGSGVVNSVLHSIAGVGPVPWLSDDQLAQLSVVGVAVWAGTGWHAILYLAYLQSIPAEYYEAATVDGASSGQMFRSITLPLLTPAMTVSTLLLLTGGLKVYDLPFTLTKGGPGFATHTITQSIIENGIAQARVGQASALAMLFLIVVGLVVLAQLFIARRLEGRYS
jgi:raffinose/stachyose/melibiose transport system permease protein